MTTHCYGTRVTFSPSNIAMNARAAACMRSLRHAERKRVIPAVQFRPVTFSGGRISLAKGHFAFLPLLDIIISFHMYFAFLCLFPVLVIRSSNNVRNNLNSGMHLLRGKAINFTFYELLDFIT